MKQPIGESLSALMDQEANELDLQRVMQGLKDGDELTQRWRRYHLASAAMHRDLDAFAQVDLSARIGEALSAEVAEHPVRLRLQRYAGLLRPVANVAIAASVTATILGSAQLYHWVTGGAEPVPVVVASNGDVSAALAVSRGFGLGGPKPHTSAMTEATADGLPVLHGSVLTGRHGVDSSQADALARQKLNSYLQSHLENASLNTSSGMMPFARAASYRSER